MAQTGFTPIQLYRTTTASAVPTSGNLADGELGINLTDEKLYFKNAGGTVKLLASNAGAAGDVVAASNNAFTGANTFYNATGQTFGTGTATQDGIIIAGRAGGSSTYRVTFQPGTLTASRTLTAPDATTTIVGTDATQTLTNKTVETLTLNKGYTEQVFALGTTGSIALNPTNGSIQTCALTGNPTFTDSLSAGQSIVLMLTNGASYTVGWPTITWVTSAGNVAPTLTAANTLVFWKVSTTLYGAVVGSYA